MFAPLTPPKPVSVSAPGEHAAVRAKLCDVLFSTEIPTTLIRDSEIFVTERHRCGGCAILKVVCDVVLIEASVEWGMPCIG